MTTPATEPMVRFRTVKWERGEIRVAIEDPDPKGRSTKKSIEAVNYVLTAMVAKTNESVGLMEHIFAQGHVHCLTEPVAYEADGKVKLGYKTFLVTLSFELYADMPNGALRDLADTILVEYLPKAEAWPPRALVDTDAATWLSDLVGDSWSHA